MESEQTGRLMTTIVHSAAAIQAMLTRGLTPTTDNRDALIDLGFQRAYPQFRAGYESTIWERSIVLEIRARNGERMLGRQRAFLDRSARR
jgi:hypothetical protein